MIIENIYITTTFFCENIFSGETVFIEEIPSAVLYVDNYYGEQLNVIISSTEPVGAAEGTVWIKPI